MTYNITYFSPQGHIREIAEEMKKCLPAEATMNALTQKSDLSAEIQLVGFELCFRDLDKLPGVLVGLLRRMKGKQVFVFATIPFYIDESQKSQIHRNISQALPLDARYLGLYLCSAQPEQALLEGFRHAAQLKPDSTRIRYWLKRCEYAMGHPNESDIQQGCRLLQHVIK